MQDTETSLDQERRNPGSERWLAMRTAYMEYLRASEALESAAQTAEEESADYTALPSLVGQQRVAFERYLEARMEFLEFRFDEIHAPGPGHPTPAPPVPAAESTRFPSLAANLPLVMQMVTVVILGLTIFFLLQERQKILRLETARDELQANLRETRDGLRLLTSRIDAALPAERSSTAPVGSFAQPGSAAPPKEVNAPKLLTKGGWRPVTKPSVPAYRRFTLERSRQFKRIGPIEVSLRSVDPQGNTVSLAILSESGSLHFDHLKPNQPVRIHTSSHRKGLELVIDRIGRDGLYGHLIEPVG
jgi:hypothetical protein